AGLERGPARTDEELFDRESPATVRSGGTYRGAQHQQRWRGVGAWRGVAGIPGDRGEVTDLDRADQLRRIGKHWILRKDKRVVLDRSHGGQGADPQRAVTLFQAPHAADSFDVYDGARAA